MIRDWVGLSSEEDTGDIRVPHQRKGYQRMSVSDKAHKLLNDQITNEFGAGHKYMAMAFSLEAMGLMRLSERFLRQAEEERGHAMKFVKYLQDIDRGVKLGAVGKPKTDFKSVREIFEAALASEETVTKQIEAIADQARADNDHATESFIKWFIDEQVEEVATVKTMIQLLDLAGDMPLLLVEDRIASEIGDEPTD